MARPSPPLHADGLGHQRFPTLLQSDGPAITPPPRRWPGESVIPDAHHEPPSLGQRRAIIAKDGGRGFMARAIIAKDGGRGFMARAIFAKDGGRGFMARAIIAKDGGRGFMARAPFSGEEGGYGAGNVGWPVSWPQAWNQRSLRLRSGSTMPDAAPHRACKAAVPRFCSGRTRIGSADGRGSRAGDSRAKEHLRAE